eukprot:2135730-Rhodomonas_salina.2
MRERERVASGSQARCGSVRASSRNVLSRSLVLSLAPTQCSRRVSRAGRVEGIGEEEKGRGGEGRRGNGEAVWDRRG